MDEIEKSEKNSLNEYIKKIFEIANFTFNNKIYLFPLIIYTIFSIILFYLVIISTQEIINFKLINLILNFYFKDRFFALTTLIGLVGALTILIGYISSENDEKISGQEGKLWLGLVFWHRNFLTKAGILILIIIFTRTYYGFLNYHELFILFLLIIIFYLAGRHFKNYSIDVYDWNTLETIENKIYLDIFFGISAFDIGFFFYIYSLQFVETYVFIFLNSWILFLIIILLASFKFPRTKRIIIKYVDNKEEYAHLVRIESGFARIITKNCGSKQINLSEIKCMNYDAKYIENFKNSFNKTFPWNTKSTGTDQER